MRNKLYTARVEINITPRQKEQLERIARKRDLTVNQLIREMIEKNI